MALRYCFESSHISRTLAKCKPSDLAVIDTSLIPSSAVRKAVDRGVWVYGYLNVGALEDGRPYYQRFKRLRLAYYDGWDGEYWIDPTDSEWQLNIINQAKAIKACGGIGVYLDNTDIYYMCSEGFREEGTHMLKKAPTAQAVYNALKYMVLKINALGLVVMPNGGDTFVRRFHKSYPSILKTVNQEGVLYLDNKRQSKEDTKYYTEYLDWCKKQGFYIRGIEYTNSKTAALKCKAYYKLHGWQGLYISKHKELRGD